MDERTLNPNGLYDGKAAQIMFGVNGRVMLSWGLMDMGANFGQSHLNKMPHPVNPVVKNISCYVKDKDGVTGFHGDVWITVTSTSFAAEVVLRMIYAERGLRPI